MKNKKVFLSLLIGLVLIGGAVFGVIHQQQAKAERIAHEKQEAIIKAEKKNLSNAISAVESAYKTRDKKEIELAYSAISKLKDKQKKDKSNLTAKMTTLDGFIKQVSDVNTSLNKATQSKSDKDIQATQTLIDKETDPYLKSDKVSAQKKLNDLKAKIAKEKTAQTESKKVSTKTQVQNQNQNQEQNNANVNQGTQDNGYSGGGYQEPQYQEPQYQAPADNTPQYQAPPAPPVNNTPAPPVGGGGAANNNNAQDAANNVQTPAPPSNQHQNDGTVGDGAANGAVIPGQW